MREETEKLRRRKAREERLAAEAIAARLQAERYQAAEAQEYARRAKEVEKVFIPPPSPHTACEAACAHRCMV